MSIVEFIELQLKTRYQAPAPDGAVDALLNTGDAIVLFDGLDELIETSMRAAVSEKVELFSTKYPASRVFITSRKVGYKEAKLDPTIFKVFELSGYSDENVESYVKKWFDLQHSENNASKEDLTRGFLNESKSIPDLRKNPLLLSLLCIIYRGQGYLPKNRVGVYSECSKLLFQTWDRSRGIVFDFNFERHIEDALKHLAYWMFTLPNSGDGVEENQLVRELSQFFRDRAFENAPESEKAASEFIHFCRGRAWVLSEAGSSPEGTPLFKFTHRTFMEYFAASQITRKYPEPKALARHILPKVARQEWDTVGQLAIHLINESADRGAEKALKQMLSSSRKRSIEYRENVSNFIASSIDSLAIGPGLVRESVKRSLLISYEMYPDQRVFIDKGFYPVSWVRYASLKDDTEIIADEFKSWITEGLNSSDMKYFGAALQVLTQLPLSPSRNRIEWFRKSREIGLENKHQILTKISRSNSKLMGLYKLGIISFSEWKDHALEDPAFPIEFIFKSLQDNSERNQIPLYLWFLYNLSHIEDRGIFVPNPRLLNTVARDIYMDLTSTAPPWVRASLVGGTNNYLLPRFATRRVNIGAFERPGVSRLILPSALILACVYIESLLDASGNHNEFIEHYFAISLQTEDTNDITSLNEILHLLHIARTTNNGDLSFRLEKILSHCPDATKSLISGWIANKMSFTI